MPSMSPLTGALGKVFQTVVIIAELTSFHQRCGKNIFPSKRVTVCVGIKFICKYQLQAVVFGAHQKGHARAWASRAQCTSGCSKSHRAWHRPRPWHGCDQTFDLCEHACRVALSVPDPPEAPFMQEWDIPLSVLPIPNLPIPCLARALSTIITAHQFTSSARHGGPKVINYAQQKTGTG